jgi:NAD(P)-dependent dehydrogenase (short-subunit alcohol dehydrogenase family)
MGRRARAPPTAGRRQQRLAVLSRYQAKELAPRGIRLNAVAPGPTRTRLGGEAFERFPDVIPPLVERTALGRLGEGDNGVWVTGEHIEVAGGVDL